MTTTSTATVRRSISTHWVIVAIAVALVATALIVSLLAAVGGSSGASTGTSSPGTARCSTGGGLVRAAC